MKKFNVAVVIVSTLLAISALLIFCCAKCVAEVGGTNLTEAGLLVTIVASAWASLCLATRPADEAIVLCVPCPRCGGAGLDRVLCDGCVEAICWEQVSRAEAKGDDLSFEDWFAENEEILMEEVAENDLDREGDFDFESWAEARFFESK
jgi:hypothetical protein